VLNWLDTVILGLIEGVTEFLPVSSTGHLLIAERWLEARGDVFNSVIQCGAVVAVVMVFAGRLKSFYKDWRAPETQSYLMKLAVAFVITGMGGLALKAAGFKQQDESAEHARMVAWVVAWTTLGGGVVILLLEQWLKGRKLEREVTWTVALAAALAQLLAVILPGTSRSASTILAALALGTTRPVATEFSFLLGVPTLLAAGLLQTCSALKHGQAVDWTAVALGTAVSAVTAFGVVKWLLRYVQTHTFTLFGWYRIALGVVILWVLKKG
jgi:undecaprenyl-diphosphatase